MRNERESRAKSSISYRCLSARAVRCLSLVSSLLFPSDSRSCRHPWLDLFAFWRLSALKGAAIEAQTLHSLGRKASTPAVAMRIRSPQLCCAALLWILSSFIHFFFSSNKKPWMGDFGDEESIEWESNCNRTLISIEEKIQNMPLILSHWLHVHIVVSDIWACCKIFRNWWLLNDFAVKQNKCTNTTRFLPPSSFANHISSFVLDIKKRIAFSNGTYDAFLFYFFCSLFFFDYSPFDSSIFLSIWCMFTIVALPFPLLSFYLILWRYDFSPLTALSARWLLRWTGAE